MVDSLNLKKLGSREYRIARILQAPEPWQTFYRGRLKEIGRFDKAVIFPEQLLGLNQNCVYAVSVVESFGNSGNTITSTIYGLRSYRAKNADGDRLETIDDILRYEQSTVNKLSSLYVGQTSGGFSFKDLCIFTTATAATKYQSKIQASCLSGLG
jgi:hypothetical protein